MKHFIILLIICCRLDVHAQVGGKSVPDFTTKLGTPFHRGDTLRLGLGTYIDGRFKYLVIPLNVSANLSQAIPLDAFFTNQQFVIRDLRMQNARRSLICRIVAVIKIGEFEIAVDLNTAEEVGEIYTTHNQHFAAQPVIILMKSATEVAGEILKLKMLLEAGIITQQEFDTQKSRLLAGK